MNLNSVRVGAVLTLLVLFFVVSPSTTSAMYLVNNPNSSNQKYIPIDSRVLVLKSYLTEQNSPLKDYASEIIAEADKNEIDWRLLPTIAAVESRFGQVIPYGKGSDDALSHNAWGWGVHSGRKLYFDSWEQGIEKVSFGLKTKFVDLGLDTPAKMNPKYSSNPEWTSMVEYYIADLNTFEKDFMQKYGSRIEAYNRRVPELNLKSQLSFRLNSNEINFHF